MHRVPFPLLAFGLLGLPACGGSGGTSEGCRSASPYAAAVLDVRYGPQAGYGAAFFPDNVLGPPAGGGLSKPARAENEVLSLGNGGWIALEMGLPIVDGPGADFLVFENPFRFGGGNQVFIEAAAVEVSMDGVEWAGFPFDVEPGGEWAWSDPDRFQGLAGVHPVFANPERGIDPLDPEAAGGDPFDLAEIGWTEARYLRLTDTGHSRRAPGSEMHDGDGDWVDDFGNHSVNSGNKEGFDLDAAAALHAGECLP